MWLTCEVHTYISPDLKHDDDIESDGEEVPIK